MKKAKLIPLILALTLAALVALTGCFGALKQKAESALGGAVSGLSGIVSGLTGDGTFHTLNPDSALKVAELSTDKAVYQPGEPITVTLRFDGSVDNGAWAGIVPSSVEHGSEDVNDQNDLDFFYLTSLTDDKYTFTDVLAPGSYDVRVNDNEDGGAEVAYVSFAVTDGAASEAASASASGAGSATNTADAGYAPGERTAKLFGYTLCRSMHPVHMQLKMAVEIEDEKYTSTVVNIYEKGDKTALDFTADTIGHITNLTLGDKYYSILHAQKLILKQTAAAISVPGGIGDYDEEHYGALTFRAGTEVIDGVSYDYDEMIEGDDTTRVYFKTGTEQWVFMRTGDDPDELITVLGYDQAVVESFFELPADYETYTLDTGTDLGDLLGGGLDSLLGGSGLGDIIGDALEDISIPSIPLP